jgi:hypothetical protein
VKAERLAVLGVIIFINPREGPPELELLLARVSKVTEDFLPVRRVHNVWCLVFGSDQWLHVDIRGRGRCSLPA